MADHLNEAADNHPDISAVRPLIAPSRGLSLGRGSARCLA